MSDPVMVEHDRRMSIFNGYSAMPMPDEQQIKDGAHILSEILDDAAPLHEQRYRFPAREMLRYAAWVAQQEHPNTLELLFKSEFNDALGETDIEDPGAAKRHASDEAFGRLMDQLSDLVARYA